MIQLLEPCQWLLTYSVDVSLESGIWVPRPLWDLDPASLSPDLHLAQLCLMCKPFWKGSCRSVIFSRWLEAVTCSCCYCRLAMSQTLEPGLSSHGPRRGWSHGARHSETHRKSGRLLCSEEDSALASILRFYSLTRIRGVLKCVALFPNQSSASSLTSWYFLFIQS